MVGSNTLQNYNLYNFYLNFGDDWKVALESQIRKTITNLMVKYDYNYLFQNRANFKTKINDNLISNLKNFTKNLVTVYSLQMFNVIISPELDDSIINKIIQNQMAEFYEYEGQIAATNKTIERLERQMKADMEYTNMVAISNYEASKVNIQSACLDSIMKSDMDAYSSLDSGLGLSTDSNLVNFIAVNEEQLFNGKLYNNFENINLIQN